MPSYQFPLLFASPSQPELQALQAWFLAGSTCRLQTDRGGNRSSLKVVMGKVHMKMMMM